MSIRRALIISRPIGWLITGSIYLVGLQNLSHLTFLAFIELLLLTFPLNFYLYGLNDMYDYENDLNNPRKGSIHGAIITKKEREELKKHVFIPPVIFIIVSLLSFNLQHILVSIISMVIIFLYSHPSSRLKEIPFVDSFVGGSGYMLAAVIAYTLHGSITSINWLLVLFFILPLAGLHAFTTLLDVGPDQKSGILTTGIFLGKQKTLLFCAATCIVLLPFTLTHLFMFGVLVCYALWYLILAFTPLKEESEVNNAVFTALATLWVFTMIFYFLYNSFPNISMF